MERVRVFVSFDREHDVDLRDRLIAESHRLDSRFMVAGRSASGGDDQTRSGLLAADAMIVICGKQSVESIQMSGEIRMAQELHKPYFLLWGRRELMCTRPMGAKPDDAMYGWSPSIIHSQIVLTLREAQPREIPAHYKKAPPKESAPKVEALR